MEEKPWCYWQIKCQEDVEPNSWTCIAHLSSGHAHQCTYTKDDLKQSTWSPGKIILSKEGDGLGQCVDYEPEKERI